MASQAVVRKWAGEKGISCNPKGSIERDVEDMFMVDSMGYGIPIASLRAWTLACRQWNVKTYNNLGPKERINEIDVQRYVDHLTNDASAMLESQMITPALTMRPADEVGLNVCVVDESGGVEDARGQAETILYDPVQVQEAYEVLKSRLDAAKMTPIQRVVAQNVTGALDTINAALNEAQIQVDRMRTAKPEEGEGLVRETIPVLEFTAGTLEDLSTSYHLMHCTGCGDHDNYVGR